MTPHDLYRDLCAIEQNGQHETDVHRVQAMDRAHRLGQERVVTVYRLLMRGTLEERIMSLQQFKKGVAAAVVNTDNVATDSMATGDVLELVGQSAGTQGRGAEKR